jgi:RIO-like serine/threonine protein kinase
MNLDRVKMTSDTPTTLKLDHFGAIELDSAQQISCRNTDRAVFWARFISRRLAGREARALIALDNLDGFPALRGWNGRQLQRQWLPGLPLHQSNNQSNDLPHQADPQYFRAALRLLRQMHSRNIAHNDLAKEANCLMLENGSPAFIDFQLAVHSPKRSQWFRLLAREDLRHLLKHKRTYCPEYLSARQRRILASPSTAARFWSGLYKPVYLWITRSMLRWPEREGANERVFKHFNDQQDQPDKKQQ